MGGSTNTKGSQEPSPLTTMFAGHRPAWLDQLPASPTLSRLSPTSSTGPTTSDPKTRVSAYLDAGHRPRVRSSRGHHITVPIHLIPALGLSRQPGPPQTATGSRSGRCKGSSSRTKTPRSNRSRRPRVAAAPKPSSTASRTSSTRSTTSSATSSGRTAIAFTSSSQRPSQVVSERTRPSRTRARTRTRKTHGSNTTRIWSGW